MDISLVPYEFYERFTSDLYVTYHKVVQSRMRCKDNYDCHSGEMGNGKIHVDGPKKRMEILVRLGLNWNPMS